MRLHECKIDASRRRPRRRREPDTRLEQRKMFQTLSARVSPFVFPHGKNTKTDVKDYQSE